MKLLLVVVALLVLAALAVGLLYRIPDPHQPIRPPDPGSRKTPPATATQPESLSPKPPESAAVEVVEAKPGSLTKELIRHVIGRNINAVRVCYEPALQRNPAMRTRLVIKFTIGASGSVVESTVKESETGDTQVDECVRAAVQTFVFPPPDGGGVVKVTYPFIVYSAGG